MGSDAHAPPVTGPRGRSFVAGTSRRARPTRRNSHQAYSRRRRSRDVSRASFLIRSIADFKESLLPQLPDEAQEVLRALVFCDLVLLHKGRKDLGERTLLAKEMPDPSPDRVQAEIDALFQLEHHQLVLEIPEEHVIRNLDARCEGESTGHGRAPTLPPPFLAKEAVEYRSVRWLIDGYNVLRRDADLRAREAESLEAGRVALLHLLAPIAHASGEYFTVVFDGARRGQPPASGQIAVVFSRPPESADDVLGRLAREAGAGAVVVSSDRRVLDGGRRAGCAVVTAEQFLDAVRRGSAPGDDSDDEGENDATDERPGKRGNPRRRSHDDVLAARALNRLRLDRR